MENKRLLCDLKNDEKTVVFELRNFDKKMWARLIEMGFVKQQKISVIKNLKKAKTMIVSIRGYVLALDYNLAKNVIVY